MATLREFYDTDFPHDLNFATKFTVQQGASSFEIPYRVHLDFDSNAKYVSCYLTNDAPILAVCQGIINGVARALADSDRTSVEVRSGFPGASVLPSADLQFAGRVFLYHEADLPDVTKETITAAAKQQRIFVDFRGPRFAAERTRLEKPLAFICHDSRDKDEIARPVAIGLSKLMCPVWFDEFSLRVGDRLRESIERGLREARKCILIITPHFLNNGGWTKSEFNAIFTRELVERQDVVLPIWHNVSRDEVFAYSPVLADRVAVKWSVGLDEVIRRLRAVVLT